MPDLEAGFYAIVIDSLSVTAIAGVAEIGDIWVIDNANRQVLHYGTAGIGPAVGVGAIVSRQFGAVYLNSAGDIEGIPITGQSDGAIGLGGSGSISTPLPLGPVHSTLSGGPSAGFGASLGRIVNYSWFKKVYSFEEAPGFVTIPEN